MTSARVYIFSKDANMYYEKRFHNIETNPFILAESPSTLSLLDEILKKLRKELIIRIEGKWSMKDICCIS